MWEFYEIPTSPIKPLPELVFLRLRSCKTSSRTFTLLKMKTLNIISLILAVTFVNALAELPRGYEGTANFEKSQEKAISKKKFLTILFQGSNHNCPNCKTTITNGERAVKSSSVMIYSTVADYWKKSTKLPKKILDQVGNLSGGASVHFYVFNPNTLELIIHGGRKELQTDKDSIRNFKKVIRSAKKDLK